MKSRRFFKLLYFDGFAGSGEIMKVHDDPEQGIYDVDITIGAARRIIEIEEPRAIDEYYFVERKPKNFKQLDERTRRASPEKRILPLRKIAIKNWLISRIICELLLIKTIEL